MKHTPSDAAFFCLPCFVLFLPKLFVGYRNRVYSAPATETRYIFFVQTTLLQKGM